MPRVLSNLEDGQLEMIRNPVCSNDFECVGEPRRVLCEARRANAASGETDSRTVKQNQVDIRWVLFALTLGNLHTEKFAGLCLPHRKENVGFRNGCTGTCSKFRGFL